MSISRRVSTLALGHRRGDEPRERHAAQGVDVLSFAAGEPDLTPPEGQAGGDRRPAQGPDEVHAHRRRQGDLLRHRRQTHAREQDRRRDRRPHRDRARAASTRSSACSTRCSTTPARRDPARGDPPVPRGCRTSPRSNSPAGRVVEVETTPASGFKMSPSQLKEAITEPHPPSSSTHPATRPA